MEYIYNDGGRKEAGYKGEASDCGVRAIAIVTNQSYQKVYNDLHECTKKYVKKHWSKRRKNNTPNNGLWKGVVSDYLSSLGMEWIPTMFIGKGCKVHLKKSELPNGRIVVCVSKHFTAVIDGVIYDTYDCSRGGTRCVYGYYKYTDEEISLRKYKEEEAKIWEVINKMKEDLSAIKHIIHKKFNLIV